MKSQSYEYVQTNPCTHTYAPMINRRIRIKYKVKGSEILTNGLNHSLTVLKCQDQKDKGQSQKSTSPETKIYAYKPCCNEQKTQLQHKLTSLTLNSQGMTYTGSTLQIIDFQKKKERKRFNILLIHTTQHR